MGVKGSSPATFCGTIGKLGKFFVIPKSLVDLHHLVSVSTEIVVFAPPRIERPGLQYYTFSGEKNIIRKIRYLYRLYYKKENAFSHVNMKPTFAYCDR